MDEMTSPLVLTIAYAADLVAGDPQWGLHPIRLVGRLIAFFEKDVLGSSLNLLNPYISA